MSEVPLTYRTGAHARFDSVLPRETTKANNQPSVAKPPHWLELVGIASLITVLTWPVPTLRPSTGLDPSWQVALHMAARMRLHFGRDILFTYGPLGFLSEPRLVFRSTAALALAYTILVQFALCLAVYKLGRRWLHPFIAAILTLAVGLLLPLEAAEALPIVFLLWILGAEDKRVQDKAEEKNVALIRIGALLAGFQLLVKFDTGLVLALIIGILILRAQKKPVRLFEAVALFFGTILTLWVVTGNVIGDLYRWFYGSVSLTRGYSSAMGQEVPTQRFDYPLAGLLLCSFMALMLIRRRQTRSPSVSWPILGILVIVVYFEFRHSFTLHEMNHSVPFFYFLGLLPFAFAWRGSLARTAVVYVIAALAVTAIAPLPAIDRLTDLAERPVRAWKQLTTLASAKKSSEFISYGKHLVRRNFGLDASTLEALGTGSVHVDPVEVSVVWAYDLAWKPLPIFQSYTAYTTYLDDLNAKALVSTKGPARILRQYSIYFTPGNPRGVMRAIDTRNPYFEAPSTFLEAICHYREIHSGSDWEVISRTTNRCDSARELESARFMDGVPVVVPAIGPREILVARVHLRTSLTRAIAETLFKPFGHVEVDIDGDPYQLVIGTASDQLVLCVPEAGGFSSRFVPLDCPTTVRVSGAGPYEITFYAVPLN